VPTERRTPGWTVKVFSTVLSTFAEAVAQTAEVRAQARVRRCRMGMG
jgi:hypothetical protein